MSQNQNSTKKIYLKKINLKIGQISKCQIVRN